MSLDIQSKFLNSERIKQGLETCLIGRNIILFETAGSTNDIAWSYADKLEFDGLCVLAEQQTAGRGRRGRTWHSSAGQSVLCSVLLQHFEGNSSLLTLVCPVAATEAISSACSLNAVIKWPNDILIHDKKVGGILVESRKINKKNVSVLGIGINIHQRRDFFESTTLEYPATSLDIETARQTDRTHFIRTLLERLEYWLNIAAVKPQKLLAEWTKHNRQIGSRIELEAEGQRYCGTCIGIDPAEGLIVQLDRGPIRIFHASHTSIVKKTV